MALNHFCSTLTRGADNNSGFFIAGSRSNEVDYHKKALPTKKKKKKLLTCFGLDRAEAFTSEPARDDNAT
jgi:hypothetical protein